MRLHLETAILIFTVLITHSPLLIVGLHVLLITMEHYFVG
jgi:hypothetical protein